MCTSIPRVLPRNLGNSVSRLDKVIAVQINCQFPRHVFPVLQHGHGLGSLFVFHALDDTHKQLGNCLSPGCPRLQHISQNVAHVGKGLEHGASPGVTRTGVDSNPINAGSYTAHDLEIKPRRGDNYVSVEFATRLQQDAIRRNSVNDVCNKLDISPVQGSEEIAIRAETQPLLEGVISRLEVNVHVAVLGQCALCVEPQGEPGNTGEMHHELRDEHLVGDVLPPADPVRKTHGQNGPQQRVQPRRPRNRGRVAGTPLDHGQLRDPISQRRHNGVRRCARADEHDTLVGTVQILRPPLRVRHGAREALDARDRGWHGLVIGIVPRAPNDEVCRQDLGLSDVLDGQSPKAVLVAPFRIDDAVVEPDLVVRAVLSGGVLDVCDDFFGRSNLVRVRPGVPSKSKGGHVRIRPEAGELEKAPCAAYDGAALENGEATMGQLLAEDVGSVYAREAGSQDDDVVAFCYFWHLCWQQERRMG